MKRKRSQSSGLARLSQASKKARAIESDTTYPTYKVPTIPSQDTTAIRGTKDVEGDDMGGNREEEVRGILRRKRRASGELTPAKPALETHTESPTKDPVDSDAAIEGIEDINPDLAKTPGAVSVGEEEAARPVKAKMPRPKTLLKAIRGLEDVEDGDKGEDWEEETEVITIDEESVEEIFVDQPDLHAPDREDSVEI